MSTVDNHDSFLGEKVSRSLSKFININTTRLVKRPSSQELEILYYYLKNPVSIPHDYSKTRENKTSPSERSQLRHIKQLVADGLLELVTEEQKLIKGMKRKYTTPYRLSLSGILYLIMNPASISYYRDVIKYLFKNYKKNILFTVFLYTVINERTIDEIEYDVAFFEIVINYVQQVSYDIIYAVTWVKNKEKDFSKKARVVNHVPIWNNIDEDTENQDIIDKIRFFLNVALKWDKVETLKIIPHIPERIVEVLDTGSSATKTIITILKDEKKVILRQNGKKVYESPIFLYHNLLTVEIRGDTNAIDEIKHIFIERYKKHLNNFLINIRTQLIPSTSL